MRYTLNAFLLLFSPSFESSVPSEFIKNSARRHTKVYSKEERERKHTTLEEEYEGEHYYYY